MVGKADIWAAELQEGGFWRDLAEVWGDAGCPEVRREGPGKNVLIMTDRRAWEEVVTLLANDYELLSEEQLALRERLPRHELYRALWERGEMIALLCAEDGREEIVFVAGRKELGEVAKGA